MNPYPESINEKISLLILRVFGSFIFIIAGISHVVDTTGTTARLESAPLGFLATNIASAEALVMLSGWVMAVLGVMLLVGYRTRLTSRNHIPL